MRSDKGERQMSVKIEHVEWPDRPDAMMPFSRQ